MGLSTRRWRTFQSVAVTLISNSGLLSTGEIYATVVDENIGTYVPIVGRVLITRSPQIHPGDVQFVTAVRPPELSHLVNVVVFPCE